MKTIAALPLAAALAIGLATTAQAFVHVDGFTATADRGPVVSSYDPEAWHPCVGQQSGTAHHSCGTATGGPVGGLN